MEANAAIPPVQAGVETTAMATRGQTAVDNVGEVTGMDSGLTLKYLSVVYGVGGLHDKGFNEGSLVIDKRFSVTDKKTSIPVIVIGVHSYWKDWLTQADFAAGKKSRRFLTREEAAAAGCTLDWTDDPSGATNPATGKIRRIPPSASKAYDLKVLVRKPAVMRDAAGNEDNDDTLFFLPVGEHFYCPATITFEKTSKEKFEQTIQACMVMAAHEQKVPVQKAVLHRWLFTLGTEILPATGTRKASTIPVLKRMLNDQKKGASLSAEEVASLEEILGALTSARAEQTEVPADDANP